MGQSAETLADKPRATEPGFFMTIYCALPTTFMKNPEELRRAQVATKRSGRLNWPHGPHVPAPPHGSESNAPSVISPSESYVLCPIRASGRPWTTLQRVQCNPLKSVMDSDDDSELKTTTIQGREILCLI